ncbi:MAG: TonB-dependent receptor, partial [Bacteroidetes bacterium]|nr:TonB-dependent receptor [Bacteroidota bacterium]
DTLSSIDRSKFLKSENNSTEGNVILNYTVTDKINAHHLIKGGATYQNIFFNANSFTYSAIYTTYVYELKVKNANAGLVQSFIHWQWRPVEKLTLNTGIHYQNFLLNNTQAVEPRFGARWQLSQKQNISIGYGMHSMMQPTIYYFFETYDPSTDTYYRSNRNLDLTKSQHLILGYDYNFAKNYRLKFESYYQYVYDVPVQKQHSSSFSMINVGNALEGIPLVDTLINTGTGENYGLELTLEKFFSEHFYFLVTASIYDSKYKGSDNITHNTSYNGGYVFNSLAGYELTLGKNKNKSLSFDLKYTQAGGNRYTPIDLEESKLNNGVVYINEKAFSEKYKDYSRFDIKLSYKTNRKRTSQTFFVTIENIFDTQNILRETYNTETQSIQREYQLGLFPYGGYRIEF